MSGEDLATNLHSYQIQLQQVEVALTNDADNEELLKLKKDLEEVITLTTELIASSAEKGGIEGSGKEAAKLQKHRFKIGERCMAVYPKDGLHYEARVEEVSPDGHCTVHFIAYGVNEVVEVERLRPVEKHHSSEFPEGASKSRKQIIQAQKEYKKKKAQKKAQKMKQLEEEREKEKVKWHSFNTKGSNKKGHVKKSIFASPDNINGRVGIGTCGIGGKPMTEFQHQEKWRKPNSGPNAIRNAALRGQQSFM